MAGSLHTEETQKLVDWLKKQRLEQGLTMRDLAARLGVPHSFVGKVEQCERRLDVPEYVAYCRALEVSAVEGLGVLDAKVRAQLKKQNA
jgi:transcriptional regulator with XRE-family HTH domain